MYNSGEIERSIASLVASRVIPSSALDFELQVNPEYFRTRSITPKSAVTALLGGTWQLPNSPAGQNLTVGMGTTTHNARPSTITFAKGEHKTVSIPVFAKPINDKFDGDQEFNNTLLAKLRGIATVEAIALIKNRSGALVVTEMDYRIETLALRNLDYHFQDPSNYTPQQFLTEFLVFLADFHDKGFIHRDIHPGNLGFRRISASKRPKPVILDFGLSLPLSDNGLKTLRGKRSGVEDLEGLLDFYETHTLADVVAFIISSYSQRIPLSTPELIDFSTDVYPKSRRFLYDPNGSFPQKLNKRLTEVLTLTDRLTQR